MKIYKDITYSNASENCKLDLYVPDSGSFKTMIYFHGGSLETGKKSSYNEKYCKELIDNNIAFVSCEYRMYPEAKYPDFIVDAADAVAWVVNNISKYGESEGVYIGGSSAGGYLSMMLCFDERYFKNAGVDTGKILGYIHDAGQPTAHFNVLKYDKKVDHRRVIIDETAPLYYVGLQESYPRMLFIVSDNDMKNRYEQTMLTISTLKHFGFTDNISLKIMHGTHCAYVGTELVPIIKDFITKG